jgi:predicted Holliday junction resolvase-like endonuclease
MINTLILFTFLFLGLIIYLILKIQSDRLKFQSRVKYLEEIIQQLYEEQKVQNNQLQLSEELKRKIIHVNSTLKRDIYELNYNLLEGLYPKK